MNVLPLLVLFLSGIPAILCQDNKPEIEETISNNSSVNCRWNLQKCQKSCGQRRKAIVAFRSNDVCPKCFCPKYECETECELICTNSKEDMVHGISDLWKPCKPCKCNCLQEMNFPENCRVANCSTYAVNESTQCPICSQCQNKKQEESCQCNKKCSEGSILHTGDNCNSCQCRCLPHDKTLSICKQRYSDMVNCKILNINKNNGCYECNCKVIASKISEKCTPLSKDNCNLTECKNGWESDDNGCQLCKCKCAPLERCESECEVKQDQDGCPICDCKHSKGVLAQILKEIDRIASMLEKEKARAKERDNENNNRKTQIQTKKENSNKHDKRNINNVEENNKCRTSSKCDKKCDEYLVDQDNCPVCRCRKSPEENCKCVCSRTSDSETCSCECTLKTSHGISKSKETFSASTKIEEFVSHGN